MVIRKVNRRGMSKTSPNAAKRAPATTGRAFNALSSTIAAACGKSIRRLETPSWEQADRDVAKSDNTNPGEIELNRSLPTRNARENLHFENSHASARGASRTTSATPPTLHRGIASFSAAIIRMRSGGTGSFFVDFFAAPLFFIAHASWRIAGRRSIGLM